MIWINLYQTQNSLKEQAVSHICEPPQYLSLISCKQNHNQNKQLLWTEQQEDLQLNVTTIPQWTQLKLLHQIHSSSSSSHAPPPWPAVANSCRQNFDPCLLQPLQPPLLQQFSSHRLLFLLVVIVFRSPSDKLGSFVVSCSFFALLRCGGIVTEKRCMMNQGWWILWFVFSLFF